MNDMLGVEQLTNEEQTKWQQKKPSEEVKRKLSVSSPKIEIKTVQLRDVYGKISAWRALTHKHERGRETTKKKRILQ